MANVWARDRAKPFYLGLALFALASAAIGFSTTYVIPMSRGTLAIPTVAHGHGASALAWLLLLTVQSTLVLAGLTRLHRRLGQLALPLAVSVWASGILTAVWAARRDAADDLAIAGTSLVGTVTGLSLFLAFVAAGYVARNRPAAHKRWMALATIAVIWPAIFRWRHLLPEMERPDIVLGILIADLPILVAMVRDRFRYGEVHPVWLTGGIFWFVEQALEIAVFDTHWSAPFGRWLMATLP